jgi:Flp pilus assembly protein TadB
MKRILTIIVSLIALGSVGQLFCRHGHHHHHHGGDSGVGVAAGLIGASVVAGAAASSNSSYDDSAARSAEFEAKRAQAKAEELRSESMKDRMYDLQRKMEQQQATESSSNTVNILIAAVVILFIGVATLGVITLRKG